MAVGLGRVGVGVHEGDDIAEVAYELGGAFLLDIRHDHVVVPGPDVFLGAVGAGMGGELAGNAEVGAVVVLDAVGAEGGFQDAVVVLGLIGCEAGVADVNEVSDARGTKDANKVRNLLAGEPDGEEVGLDLSVLQIPEGLVDELFAGNLCGRVEEFVLDVGVSSSCRGVSPAGVEGRETMCVTPPDGGVIEVSVSSSASWSPLEDWTRSVMTSLQSRRSPDELAISSICRAVSAGIEIALSIVARAIDSISSRGLSGYILKKSSSRRAFSWSRGAIMRASCSYVASMLSAGMRERTDAMACSSRVA